MKRILALLAALLVFVPAGARKFNGYLGGGFSADFSSSYSHITLAPEIAWSISPYAYAGGSVLAGWSRSGGENCWTTGLSPYLRLHAPIVAGVRLFADAGLDLRWRKYQSYSTPYIDFDVGVRPGVMVPLGPSYLFVQVGFIGYESTHFGSVSTSHSGWRCDAPDIRVGVFLHL